MREDHHQSDEHWNCFKGNTGQTSERWDGAHMGFSKHSDTILNWTELLGWSQNKFYWTLPQLKFNLSTVHNFSHAHTFTMYTHFYNIDFHTKARCAATSNLFTYYMHDNIVSNTLHNSTFITDVFHCCCFWYTLCHADTGTAQGMMIRKEKKTRWKLMTFCCSLNAKEADSELLISVGVCVVKVQIIVCCQNHQTEFPEIKVRVERMRHLSHQFWSARVHILCSSEKEASGSICVCVCVCVHVVCLHVTHNWKQKPS